LFEFIVASIGTEAGSRRTSIIGTDYSTEAYREALKYFRKLSDLASLERRKLMGLVDQAHDVIASLPKAKSLTH
jgi:hypothetical protein